MVHPDGQIPAGERACIDMAYEVPDRSSIDHGLRPSIPIRLVDRFGVSRKAVVGWNPHTAGFEAAVTVFDLDAGHYCSIPGSPSTSTVPAAVVFGREPTGYSPSAIVTEGEADPGSGPWRRSLCLTIDSLVDVLRFDGFQIDVADSERLSDLADEVERCNGPTLLRGRRWTADDGPRTRLRIDCPALPGGLTILDGRCRHRRDVQETARCLIELCWSRRWTAVERDLGLALTLEILTDAQNDFCFSASDIAVWCLAGCPIPNRAGGPGDACPGAASGQLRLPLWCS